MDLVCDLIDCVGGDPITPYKLQYSLSHLCKVGRMAQQGRIGDPGVT